MFIDASFTIFIFSAILSHPEDGQGRERRILGPQLEARFSRPRKGFAPQECGRQGRHQNAEGKFPERHASSKFPYQLLVTVVTVNHFLAFDFSALPRRELRANEGTFELRA